MADIFKCIFLNEYVKITMQISLKFVPKDAINNTQSGTKPNLVAKIWPPNLVTICAWLPKLVVNVSSQFKHLVNTELAVGFLVKWLPIMVTHTCKLDTSWVVFSCDQAALWMVQSVCLSVCPSVRLSVRPSHLFDYVPINVSSWNF